MRIILPLLLLLVLAVPATLRAQEDDALSADALDRLVRVQGETLNFDDVIRATRDDAGRLDTYDLRWVNSSRVGGSGTFPIVREETNRDVSVGKKNLPWSSGYWPSVKCRLALGREGEHGLSPMERYDSYMLTEKGTLPCAAAWEANPTNGHNKFAMAYERPRSAGEENKPLSKTIKMRASDGSEYEVDAAKRFGWHGHCNGWAAAACLVPQPPATLEVKLGNPLKLARLKYRNYAEAYDIAGQGEEQYRVEERRERKLTFSRSDLKGLLTESFMDCIARMSHPVVRNRYLDRGDVRDRGFVYSGVALGYYDEGSDRQRAQESIRQQGGKEFADIYPHNFHRICLDYLQQRNQAFVTEIDADAMKDNHPTYGYKYSQRYDEGSNAYTFSAKVLYATYSAPEHDGPNPLEIKYSFTMKLDERNRIVSSEWMGASEFNHPDFIWVPVSNSPAGKYENKNLDYDVLQKLIATAGLSEEDRPETVGVQGNGPAMPSDSEPTATRTAEPAGSSPLTTGLMGGSGEDEVTPPAADVRSDLDTR